MNHFLAAIANHFRLGPSFDQIRVSENERWLVNQNTGEIAARAVRCGMGWRGEANLPGAFTVIRDTAQDALLATLEENIYIMAEQLMILAAAQAGFEYLDEEEIVDVVCEIIHESKAA